MNQRLILACALAGLTACGTLDRRNPPSSPTPAVAEKNEVPLHLEEELKNETVSEKNEAPADSQQITPAETSPEATITAPLPLAPQEDVSIVLKDKNGKVVKTSAPSTMGSAAPAMPTPTSALAKADAVKLPTPAAQDPNQISTEPTTPLVTDEDFEVTKASQRVPGKVKGDQALVWLKNGNKRFTKGHLRKDGQSKKDMKRLVASEQPHSVILSCSDSRTPPEIVFDQKLGEIYVVRTAGPSLDQSVIASLEYAIERLGSNLLVVMGHTGCDTIKTALHSMQGHPVKSPHLAQLVAAMHPRLKPFSRRPASANLKEESWTNVSGVTQELLQKSVLIRTAMESGTLKIQEALYDMNQGSVDFKEH